MAKRAKPTTGASQSLVAQLEPKSAAAEAYRTLRTSIQFAGLDHKCRSIVVTSSSPGEGKSTTVANFGVVVAQTGARVLAVHTDVTQSASVQHAVSEAERAFGSLDVLVNNAGINVFSDPLTMTDDDWRRCFAVDLDGVWNGCRAALKLFRTQQCGQGDGNVIQQAGLGLGFALLGLDVFPG